MPRTTSQEAAVGQHLVALQGARGWKSQGFVCIVSFSFVFIFLFYCAEHVRHQKQSTANKQTNKNPQSAGKQYS